MTPTAGDDRDEERPEDAPPPFLGLFAGRGETPEEVEEARGESPEVGADPAGDGEQAGPWPDAGAGDDRPDQASQPLYAGYSPYAPYAYYPPPYAGQPSSRARVPGWVWPVVAGVALVSGLLGGLLGGLAVVGVDEASRQDSLPQDVEGPLPSAEVTAGPLPRGNRSISAVAARLLPSTVQVVATAPDGDDEGRATGSGFVVDGQGHVITNNHVVAVAGESGRIQVVENSGRAHEASIVGTSPVYDLAVLDVRGGRRLQPATIGRSQRLVVGETVVAIGSPLGLSSTVTSGIVSALDRPVTTADADTSSYINAVQTDAAINPGNSGGPLVNLRGQVVGVNSAIATTGSTLAGTSGSIGVGFAIPMEQVRVTANQILRTGRAEYPVIGANVNTTAAGDAVGAEVMEVPADGPAADAGLEPGDVVIAVDDTRITTGIGLIVAIRTNRPGDIVTLTVVRDGVRRNVQVTLAAEVG